MIPQRFYDLWDAALAIPELGGGGSVVAPRLVELAERVPAGACIVETGPWFGSTTAFLAIGSWLNPAHPTVHSYDLWRAGAEWVLKAWRYNKIALAPDQDLKPLWQRNVRHFPGRIVGHQGDALALSPPRAPVGLLVDDCTSGVEDLARLFANFERRLIDGAVVVVMDYYFARTKRAPEFVGTIDYFRSRPDTFEGPRRIGRRGTVAAFTYRAGA